MLPIISCEHASNSIPDSLAHLFASQRNILESHRGFDLGAQKMAELLAGTLKAPLFLASVSRLVVDCNRSLGHPGLFSALTRELPPLGRETILAHHYHPYRQEVLNAVGDAIQQAGSCLHVGVHSFAPALNGKRRTAEIGLLYDPSRIPERNFCRSLGLALKQNVPDFRTRFNYPYRGISDGLIAALRKSFSPAQYLGIELELNQSVYCPTNHWPLALCQQLCLLLSDPDRHGISGRC